MTIEGLVAIVIWLIVVGLIFYVLWWLVGYLELPEPINKVVRVLLAVLCALVIIYLLLQVAGPMPRLR